MYWPGGFVPVVWRRWHSSRDAVTARDAGRVAATSTAHDARRAALGRARRESRRSAARNVSTIGMGGARERGAEKDGGEGRRVWEREGGAEEEVAVDPVGEGGEILEF